MLQKDSINSPIKRYRFCPVCGDSFEYRGGNYLKCHGCGYDYFVNQAPTVGVAIFNNKDQVMLAKRKFDPQKGAWQTVGGFMDLGENIEDAIRREVKEEIGVDVRFIGYLGSYPEIYDYRGTDIPFLSMYFLAEIIDGTPVPADDVAEIQYFSADDLKGLRMAYPNLRDLLVDYINNRKYLIN